MAVPLAGLAMASPAYAGGGGYGGGSGGYGGYGGSGGHTPPPPVCPSGTGAVTNVSYVLQIGTTTTTVTSLGGNTQDGESVTANFTIAPGCTNIEVTLVSYRAPAATFNANTANQQTVFDVDTATFNAGPGTLQVFIPAGYYQIDFVLGAVITTLGPANSNNFYSSQNRLLDHDNSGSIPTSSIDPGCTLTAILAGPPTQLEVTVVDTGYGLKSIVVTELINATVVVPTFTVGTAQPLLVVATKVDQTQTGYLGLQVTNTAGLVTNCDPPF